MTPRLRAMRTKLCPQTTASRRKWIFPQRRSLAHPWRPDEATGSALHIPWLKLLHRQVIRGFVLLDLLQIVWSFVQNLRFGGFSPCYFRAPPKTCSNGREVSHSRYTSAKPCTSAEPASSSDSRFRISRSPSFLGLSAEHGPLSSLFFCRSSRSPASVVRRIRRVPSEALTSVFGVAAAGILCVVFPGLTCSLPLALVNFGRCGLFQDLEALVGLREFADQLFSSRLCRTHWRFRLQFLAHHLSKAMASSQR